MNAMNESHCPDLPAMLSIGLERDLHTEAPTSESETFKAEVVDDGAKIAIVISNGRVGRAVFRAMLSPVVPGNDFAVRREMLKYRCPDVHSRTVAIGHDDDIWSFTNDMVAKPSSIKAV